MEMETKDPRHRWNKRVGDCQEGSGCTCALTITEGWQPTLDFQVLLRGNSQTEKEQLGTLKNSRTGDVAHRLGLPAAPPEDLRIPNIHMAAHKDSSSSSVGLTPFSSFYGTVCILSIDMQGIDTCRQKNPNVLNNKNIFKKTK